MSPEGKITWKFWYRVYKICVLLYFYLVRGEAAARQPFPFGCAPEYCYPCSAGASKWYLPTKCFHYIFVKILILPWRVTCPPPHLIHLRLITLIVYGEGYTPCNPSRHYVCLHVTFSSLGPEINLHTNTKQLVKLGTISFCLNISWWNMRRTHVPSSQNFVWSSDPDGRAYAPIYTQTRTHTSNHARMCGEASRNDSNSIHDQSRLLFNDGVS